MEKIKNYRQEIFFRGLRSKEKQAYSKSRVKGGERWHPWTPEEL